MPHKKTHINKNRHIEKLDKNDIIFDHLLQIQTIRSEIDKQKVLVKDVDKNLTLFRDFMAERLKDLDC